MKKELQRAVEAIVEEDDDDCDLEATERAIRTLCALKDLKSMQNHQPYPKFGSLGFAEPPQEFKCPLSGIVMEFPVVVASGQTLDEKSIRRWLETDRSCPMTKQELPHCDLIPNLSVKKMIMEWNKLHSADTPASIVDKKEEHTTYSNEEHLMELLRRLSCSTDNQDRDAVEQIRKLTYKSPSFRTLFGKIEGAIPCLIQSVGINHDLMMQEDLLAIIFNISTDEDVRNKIVADCGASVISFLITSLGSENSVEMSRHAAAALNELSKVDSYKTKIGESGVFPSLFEVLRFREGNLFSSRDAALAILNLCTVIQNRERAISDGAVMPVYEMIKDRILIDEMLDILAMLSRHQKAVEDMEGIGILHCLFDLLKESSTTEQNKENCVAIIHAMCMSNRRNLRNVDRIENGYEILSQVVRTGTSRAKRKATDILNRLSKFVYLHSA
ncbi:U-box domain-containing protein 9-like isoform X2 [Andrographis paniculata]|nr:U-box domain-containing protein 9-like isoform X2 [Andrographis paniculata]